MTDEQRKHLRELKTVLLEQRLFIEPRLNMEHCCVKRETDDAYGPSEARDTLPKDCGTTGCLLGWAAAFEIGNPEESECWSDYFSRVFGNGRSYGALWDNVFSANLTTDFDACLRRIDESLAGAFDEEEPQTVFDVNGEPLVLHRLHITFRGAWVTVYPVKHRLYIDTATGERSSKWTRDGTDRLITHITDAGLWSPHTDEIKVYVDGDESPNWLIGGL